MKKFFAIFASLAMVATMSAQTLLSEGFEQGSIPSSWTLVDSDGDGHGWMITRDNACAGSCSLTSETWSYSGGALHPDNWLISPAVTISDSGCVLNWVSSAVDSRYPGDKYSVYISTSNSVESFLEAGPSYTEVVASADCAGRMLNLNAYVGQTIYIAFRHYDCADVLAMKLDDIHIFVPESINISADRAQLPFMVNLMQSATIGCELSNHSDQVVSSVGIKYIVNGTDTSSLAIITGLGLRPDETAIVYSTVPFVPHQPGLCHVEVVLSDPNGLPDEVSDNSAEGSFLVPDPEYAVERTLVIEQFTGSACGACPAGHDRIEQALGNRSDYVWLMHHTFGTDDFSNEASYALKWFYGVDGEYAPAVMFDRNPIPADYAEPIRNVDDVPEIRQELVVAKNRPCFLSLDMSGVSYDAQTRRIAGNVHGRFTQEIFGPDTRIVMYLVEDSLWMYQSDYIHGSSNRTHDKVVRGAINGKWGEHFDVFADGSFSYAIDYALSTNHNASKCRLAAVVYNYDQNNLNDCAVMNGAETPYLSISDLGISQVSDRIAVSVYPNPASTAVHVVADASIREIRLVDMVGRQVSRLCGVDAESAVVSTEGLDAGVYLLTITTDSGIATQRISVVR